MKCEWCDAEMGDDPAWPYCSPCIAAARVGIDEETGAACLVPAMHVWRVRTVMPERFGQFCHVLATGRLNNALVLFGDGLAVITSRYFVRKRFAK